MGLWMDRHVVDLSALKCIKANDGFNVHRQRPEEVTPTLLLSP